MKEILDRIAQENGWDNWNEVMYHAENRRTIDSILDLAIIEFEGFGLTKINM